MSDSERVSAPSLFSMTPEDAERVLVWFEAYEGLTNSPEDDALMLRIVVWLQRARDE